MTHEFKKIVSAHQAASEEGHKSVLATVVALNGSSYRRPGVRMLILENQKMVGAVSGGCVEKEVARQAADVFSSGIPRLMTYDGRYRLGCEGILYILLEPFNPSKKTLQAFTRALEKREPFRIVSYFDLREGQAPDFGSSLVLKNDTFPLRSGFQAPVESEIFEEKLDPCFKLWIFGAEHDAVQLCTYASLTGWEVVVVAPPTEEKSAADFPGARELVCSVPEELELDQIDEQTAVLLMSHSYVKDLKYLIALKDSRPAYLGLLGPAARREKLLNDLLEHCPEVSETFFDGIYGPAGLNIGAETPQEIAIAILSEILTVTRNKEPMRLRNKKGAIHS